MAAFAQQWEVPLRVSEGTAPLRSEFVSYDTRVAAETRDRTKSRYYKDVEFKAVGQHTNANTFIAKTDLDFRWEGRRTYLHVEGLSDFTVEVNHQRVGSSGDSRTPSEFDITQYIADGKNSFTLEVYPNTQVASLEAATYPHNTPLRCFVYSQPELRVEDFRVVSAAADSTGSKGVLTLDVTVANDSKQPEVFTVGYEIYSPQGKMLYYNLHEFDLEPTARETVRFEDVIKESLGNLWAAGSPKVYKAMVYVRQQGRYLEYIPFNIGFGTTTYNRNYIYRNGKQVNINGFSYNSDPTPRATTAQIKSIAAKGYNTIFVDYPQPYWFYDICDDAGVYVIDRANINIHPNIRGNINIGGSAVNDPRMVDIFVNRIAAAYTRSANHPCVIALSLGGECGNGYNMYKAYQAAKQLNGSLPVVYADAEGDWNSDIVIDIPIK